MKYIKSIIPLILVISILVCTSVSASAISTSLPDVTASDAIMRAWGTSNYSWSQNSSTHNMTLTAPYGDTSVLHGIMQGQALQNNTVMALRDDVLSWLNNTTYGGKAISNLINDCKNFLNSTQSYLSTIKTDVSSIKSYLGTSSTYNVYSKLSTIDSNIDVIQNILGSSASSGNIADIASDIASIKNNTIPTTNLKTGWGSSLSNILSTYPTGYSTSYYLNVLRELDAIRSNTSSSGSSGTIDYSSILNDIYSDTSHSRLTLDDISDYSAHHLRWEENSNIYNSYVGTATSSLALYQFLTNWSPSYSSPFPTDNDFTLGTGFGVNSSSDFWHSVDVSLSNLHDYSSDVSGILNNTSSISQNMHDYSNDFSTINDNLSNLASESTAKQISNYLSEGIYTKGQYTLFGNPISFDAGVSSSIVAGTLDFRLSQLGSGTPSPDNRREIVTVDSISLNAGDSSYSFNLPATTSAFTYDLVTGNYYSDQYIYSPTYSDAYYSTVLDNTVRILFNVPVTVKSYDFSNVCDYLPYIGNWQLDSPHFYVDNNRVVMWVPKSAVEGYSDVYAYLEANPYTFSLTLEEPFSLSLDSFAPTLSFDTTIQANVGSLYLTISSYSPYFQQNINILSSQLSALSGVSSKLDDIVLSTSDLSNVLANQTDVEIRENSTTIINEYNNSFVSGSNGLSSSDISDYADTLGAVKSTLDSDFDFTSVVTVLTDLTNNGLSFWNESVHSSLNPFGGVDDD